MRRFLVLATLPLTLAAFPLATPLAAAPAISPAAAPLAAAVAAAEADPGGRIGIVLQARGQPAHFTHHATDRFPMASTFKVALAAAVLARVDRGDEQLNRQVPIRAADLVAYSPVTGPMAGKTMPVAALCAAAIMKSDNSAANLLLQTIGGPAGLTRFLRGIGDDETRLDRIEPDLNEGTPGDPRDSTTPAAMARTLSTLLFSDVLRPESRRQLRQWMADDQVAGSLLRASLPPGWTIADKTGAGGNGARAIIAVVRPPAGTDWIVTLYLAESSADLARRDAAIARIGAALFAAIEAAPEGR